jgi:hypothetical protein
MGVRHLFFSISLLSAVFASPLQSQQDPTRTSVIADAQADKAQTLQPYEPTAAERVFLAIKREFIDSPSGFYPLTGTVYKGTGFAAGGGYRFYVHDRTYADAKGLWSWRTSTLMDLAAHSPGHFNDRVDLNLSVGRRDVSNVAFFGIGPNSPDQEVDFPFTESFGGAGVRFRPFGPVVLGSRANFERYEFKADGNSSTVAPGLGQTANYLHLTESAGIDWRPAEGYARSGGLYEVRYNQYDDRHGVLSFDRAASEVVQHFPIFRETWVISTHGLVESLVNERATTPYLLMPSLGGSDTLRGYPAWRFRDRNSLLLQGDFRWIPNRYGMDMALFYDTGKVAGRRSELNFRGLKSDVGAEVRFHGQAQTPLRFGIARGREGWNFIFAGTAAF